MLKLDRYHTAALQFSRGCPFRCEFCDIIVMFGRKPRVKSFDQVGRELDEMRRFGVRNVFFVDDNLIGNLPVAKALLQFLRVYQEKHEYRFNFGTEASLNMAQHADLLRLFRDANFGWVFIGIESTNPDSLKETLKTQNLHEDILSSIRRVYSYGIEVLAGFIIGFDHDSLDSFEQQYRFITDAERRAIVDTRGRQRQYAAEYQCDSEAHGLRGDDRQLYRALSVAAARSRDRQAHQEQVTSSWVAGLWQRLRDFAERRLAPHLRKSGHP